MAARRQYRVVWEIDLDADSPLEAARDALAIQRDTESIATVYMVEDRSDEPALQCFDVDLDEGTVTRRGVLKSIGRPNHGR